MQKIKYFIVLFAISLTSVSVNSNTWGPKFSFHITNEIQQFSNLFVGVDTNATDGYDTNVVFHFIDTNKNIDTFFKEDIDLPPPPPSQFMYCRLIKDSMQLYSSYSYADMRGIPQFEDAFMHFYHINIAWANTAAPEVKINWGKLPQGIDSAKLHCYQWYEEDKYINMKEEEELVMKNEFYNKDFYIYVWYNKNHTSIDDNSYPDNGIQIFPNPVSDFIKFSSTEQLNEYSIFDMTGYSIQSGKLFSASDNINIKSIPLGEYFINFENNFGKRYTYKFLKK